jgi:hypothetical protein
VIGLLLDDLTTGAGVMAESNVRRLERLVADLTAEQKQQLAALKAAIGNAIGWRRLASLTAVGLLAAGVAREWTGHRQGAADNGETDAES